jgi:hypothetical protein
MPTINCDAQILLIGNRAVLRIPPETSIKLTSRGMVMIEGTLNRIPFQTPLEPDGRGSHWFQVSDEILLRGKLKPGDRVKLEFEQSDNWPEPDLPQDFADALQAKAIIQQNWQMLTPKAKWEWLRWIRSAKNPETRMRRINLAGEKLSKGVKRPCCYNSNQCSISSLSRNGVLLDPDFLIS